MPFMRGTSFVPRRKQRLLGITLAVALAVGVTSFMMVGSGGVDGRSEQLIGPTSFGSQLELMSIDRRYAVRDERPAPNDVVILAIDNNTDRELGLRFPYPRKIHAQAIRALTAAGAAAIVYDVQFLDPDASDPSGASDQSLIDAANESGRVVFASSPESDANSRSVVPVPFRGIGDGTLIDRSRVQVGIAQIQATRDGVWRWIRPFETYAVDGGSLGTFDEQLPSLSLAAYSVATGTSSSSVKLPSRMAINYVGATGQYRDGSHGKYKSGFEYINYVNILSKDAELSWVKGKTVLIGQTSAVGQDIHETPVAAKAGKQLTGNPTMMPGVEIHANAISNMMNRDWLRFPSPRMGQVVALALVILVWASLLFLPFWAGIPAVLMFLSGYTAISFSAFDDNLVIPLAGPLLAGISAFISIITCLAVQAYRDRKRVTSLFSRYVSPDVVRELVDIQEELMVGGQRKNITVLFSDIRGFTSMSENIEPEELVAQLNEYFDEMTESVALQRGTLDKFIGDGMMAIFGAPLDQPDHPDRACAAALDMVERLDRLNEKRRERGLSELGIGIGLHTGDAIVGNIGSPIRRVEFTAIGDTVNLSARLESSTKDVGAQILVSKDTALAASSHVFASKGSIVVKGRTQVTEVFELRGNTEGLRREQAGVQPPASSPGIGSIQMPEERAS